jgi:uncharacterized membrane protein YkvI
VYVSPPIGHVAVDSDLDKPLVFDRTTMPSWFQRFLLPGFAFKAVVIGGGYATGRELAEFFLSSAPWGGVIAMLFATTIWSGACIATFPFARTAGARDYQTFVHALIGPGWIAFEAAYVLFVILILGVFGAAAGAIAASLGLPRIVGTLALIASIALVRRVSVRACARPARPPRPRSTNGMGRRRRRTEK